MVYSGMTGRRENVETLEAAEHERETHVVWVDEAAKVASFHHVEGYERHIFANHAFFMDYLSSLQKRGFLFQ